MITKKTWEEFRSTGLLLYINQILHAFGWAICIETEKDLKTVISSFPARVNFRGFDEESIDEEYKKINKYLLENSVKLFEELEEEE